VQIGEGEAGFITLSTFWLCNVVRL